jgi:hypothetical protein
MRIVLQPVLCKQSREEADSIPREPGIGGANNSLDDRIALIDRGLRVTRLRYIRVVQPKARQLTVRSLAIACSSSRTESSTDPITNFRWNPTDHEADV